jgi:hypothetical protein
MTAPQWLPAWPTGWPDFEESFARWVPAEWPRGLWSQDSQGHAATLTIANVMAQTRKTLEWVLESLWPWLDTNELLQARWTETFGSWKLGPRIPRYSWLVALMRLRKGMDLENLKTILIAAFGTLDPIGVGISTLGPSISNLTAYTAAGYCLPLTEFYAKHQNMLHFYDTAQSTEPDQGIFARLAHLVKPTGQQWTCGQWPTARYATKVASDVLATKTITANSDVCDPTVTGGLTDGCPVRIAGFDVQVDHVNVGGNARVFSITTWPFGPTAAGTYIESHGGYCTACYG